MSRPARWAIGLPQLSAAAWQCLQGSKVMLNVRQFVPQHHSQQGRTGDKEDGLDDLRVPGNMFKSAANLPKNRYKV